MEDRKTPTLIQLLAPTKRERKRSFFLLKMSKPFAKDVLVFFQNLKIVVKTN